MKKIISILLSIIILSSICCVSVSAADTLSPKKDLLILCDVVYYEFLTVVGGCIPFDRMDEELWDAFEYADNIFYDKNATDEDYIEARERLISAIYNLNVYTDYIQEAYELSLQEQNYNNWYSEEDWSNFVEKRVALGEALETDDPTIATDAFYDLLYACNVMTNRYTLKGDINRDGEVNVADTTLLQKYLVGKVELTGAQKMLSGAYFYESPDVSAATTIQKYCAGLISEMPNNKVFLSDLKTHENEERITQRAFNFVICPRTYLTPYNSAANGYYDTEFMRYYY